MTAPAVKYRVPARHRLSAFRFWHEVVLFGLLMGLFMYAAVFVPSFVDFGSQLGLSLKIWELALVTLPMTMIIITAGIDLSVGSTVGLAAVVLGKCFTTHAPMSICIAAALATGAAAGALNGLFITKVRVHPLIVTLATLAAYRGIAIGVTGGYPVSGFPASFLNIATAAPLGFTAPGLVVIGATIFTAIVLALTPFGRSLYAMGFNETAARFSGIPTGGIKLFLYTLSGFVSALAAVIYVARFNTAKADLGTGLELGVITAVVLGGVSIFGGRGTVVGVALGVLLIHEVQQLIPWQTNHSELNSLAVGALLIGSVLINSVLTARRR